MVGLAPQLLTLLMLAAAAPAAPEAQSTRAVPRLPERTSGAAGFAPRGWSVETEARGDLNGDGAADLVFVALAPDRPGAPLRSNPYDEDPSSYANPRMLAIAFARPEGGFRLAVTDRRFLPPKWAPNGLSQGWMLFEDGSVEITRGRLRIIFQYTRGHRTFAFRWQDGALRLIGHDVAGVEGGCLHALSVNFLTGRAKMTAGWVDRDEERIRWRAIGRRPLPSLAAIGDGEQFDPHELWMRFGMTCPERD